MKGSSGSPLTMSFQSPSSSEVSGSAMRFMMVRRSRSRTSGSNDSAARPRGLRAFLLMDLPQQADEGASLVDQLFTPAGRFQFGHAGGDDAFGVDLEIRRIELEMALGLHERVAAGRHGVHIRLAHGEFREPLGRSLFHFALRQFPEFQRIDVATSRRLSWRSRISSAASREQFFS